jgi:hypothetical protein
MGARSGVVGCASSRCPTTEMVVSKAEPGVVFGGSVLRRSCLSLDHQYRVPRGAGVTRSVVCRAPA